MGLFSGIGHFFKGILNGVKSAFEWIGKVMSSKVGRIVMLAAGVFTAGVALAAGVGAFAASSGGFLSSVTQGGSAFVSALAHPVAAFSGEISSGIENAGQALAAGAGSQTASVASSLATANAGDSAAETATAATDTGTALTAAQGGGAADSYGVDTVLSPTTGAAAPAAGGLTGPGVSTANPGAGLLSQGQAAASASSADTNGWVNGTTTPGNGAQAPGSSQVGSGLIAAGNLASGMAQGASAEKINEQQQQQAYYYGNLWNPAVKYNGNVGGAGVVSAARGTPNAPNPGYLSTAQNIAGFMGGKASGGYGAPTTQTGSTNVKAATTPNVQGPSLPSA